MLEFNESGEPIQTMQLELITLAPATEAPGVPVHAYAEGTARGPVQGIFGGGGSQFRAVVASMSEITQLGPQGVPHPGSARMIIFDVLPMATQTIVYFRIDWDRPLPFRMHMVIMD